MKVKLCFMTRKIIYSLIFLTLTSCALFQTSMSPRQVNTILPTLTESKLLSQAQANKAIKTNECKLLTKERTYTAPIGLTVKNDLKNAAKGIDEWVELDGGNAYVLISYKWITVDYNGSTQLHVKFSTLLCQ